MNSPQLEAILRAVETIAARQLTLEDVRTVVREMMVPMAAAKPLATATEFAAHLGLTDRKALDVELERARKLGAAIKVGSGKGRWRVNVDLYWIKVAEAQEKKR